MFESCTEQYAALVQPLEKRRVGRPIEYYGDADAPNLTPAERRRIRRRIANRESARRVRSRRLGELEEAQKSVRSLGPATRTVRGLPRHAACGLISISTAAFKLVGFGA